MPVITVKGTAGFLIRIPKKVECTDYYTVKCTVGIRFSNSATQ